MIDVLLALPRPLYMFSTQLDSNESTYLVYC